MVVFSVLVLAGWLLPRKIVRARVNRRGGRMKRRMSAVCRRGRIVGGKVRGKQLAAPLSTTLPSPAATDAGTGEGVYVPCASAGRRSAPLGSLDLACLTACVV
jgi:hypothetical protein